MRTWSWMCAALLASIGCAPELEPLEDEASEDETDAVEGPDTAETVVTDDVASVSVVAGNLKLTFAPYAALEMREGVKTYVFRGTANRNISEAMSFVPDDGFADVQLVTKRKLEVLVREGHELNSLASGLPLFLHLVTETDGRQYEAKLDMAPAFDDFTGASAIFVDRPIAPVYVYDGITNLRYRGRARTQATYGSFDVELRNGSSPEADRLSARKFSFDMTYEMLLANVAGADRKVSFVASQPGQKTKKAELELALAGLGLTIGSAYDVWPDRMCEDEVRVCIESQPLAQEDFGECGTYRQVSRCMSEQPQECTESDLFEIPPTPQLEAAEQGGCALCAGLEVDTFGTACAEAPIEVFAADVIARRLAAQDQVQWGAPQAIAISEWEQYLISRQLFDLSLSLDDFGGDPSTRLVARVDGQYVPTQPNVDGAERLYVIFYPDTQRVAAVHVREEYP